MKLNDELPSKEVARILIPVCSVFVPIVLSILFSDTPVLKYVFGGWNLLILIPLAFWVTKMWADKKFGPEDGRDDNFWG